MLNRLSEVFMKNALAILPLLLTLLLCAWQCSEAPPVVEQLLPAVEETRPIGTDPMAFALEMETIMQSEGEVLSPIPDDVYERLWGHFTKAGSLAPRRYYTKYINADGIAIVSSDLVDDRCLQAARHIVLVMTAKLPGLRDALSIDQDSSILGNLPFRFVITNLYSDEEPQPFDPANPTFPKHGDIDADNLPEYKGIARGNSRYWAGECGGIVCRASMGLPPPWKLKSGNQSPDRVHGVRFAIHEMAHAIEHAIIQHNLIPDFVERLEAAFAKEMDLVQRLEEARAAGATSEQIQELYEAEIASGGGFCISGNSAAHVSSAEYWAWAAHQYWFNPLWHPRTLSEPTANMDFWKEECPILFNLLAEVFPPFPLRYAVESRVYTRKD